jgi:hypothetical protein
MNGEDALERHKNLIKDGWVRRFTADEPRLSEMKEFYESLGLEVRIESGILDESQECRSCFDVEGFETLYSTIYTKGEPTCEQSVSEEMFD